MTDTSLGNTCAKCNGRMVGGFIADYADSDIRYSRWCQGHPDSAILSEIDPRSNTQWKITGYRCEECGHVELFAVDPG